MGWLRFWVAWLTWFNSLGYKPGDPLYGKGEDRRRTLKILRERHQASEPKRADYL